MFEYEEDEDPMEQQKHEEFKHHSTDHSGESINTFAVSYRKKYTKRLVPIKE